MTMTAERPVEVRAPRQVGRGMRVVYVLRSVFLTLAAVLGALSILAFAASTLLGLRPEIVISGSMEPEIPTGSLIMTRQAPASEVEIGDIVTVRQQMSSNLVTHRVVHIEKTATGEVELSLKGDANNVWDPGSYTVTTVGEHVLTIPYAGFVAAKFQNRFGLLAVVLVLLAMVAVFIIRPPDEDEDDDESTTRRGARRLPPDRPIRRRHARGARR